MAMKGGLLLNRTRQVPAEDSAAFAGIAERFRRAGDLDRAVTLCRDGLKKFPTLLSARVTLGWALLDKGLYDEARAELEQVLRRAPDNLAAIRGLAELHDRTEHLAGVSDASWQQSMHAAEPPPEVVDTLPVPSVFAPVAAIGDEPLKLPGLEASAPAAAPVELITSGPPETHAGPSEPVAFEVEAAMVASAPVPAALGDDIDFDLDLTPAPAPNPDALVTLPASGDLEFEALASAFAADPLESPAPAVELSSGGPGVDTLIGELSAFGLTDFHVEPAAASPFAEVASAATPPPALEMPLGVAEPPPAEEPAHAVLASTELPALPALPDLAAVVHTVAPEATPAPALALTVEPAPVEELGVPPSLVDMPALHPAPMGRFDEDHLTWPAPPPVEAMPLVAAMLTAPEAPVVVVDVPGPPPPEPSRLVALESVPSAEPPSLIGEPADSDAGWGMAASTVPSPTFDLANPFRDGGLLPAPTGLLASPFDADAVAAAEARISAEIRAIAAARQAAVLSALGKFGRQASARRLELGARSVA